MPASRVPSISQGRPASAAPAPATPAAMRITSETVQIATTVVTWLRRAPWRTTKAFWGPMATMSDSPNAHPEARALIGERGHDPATVRTWHYCLQIIFLQ